MLTAAYVVGLDIDFVKCGFGRLRKTLKGTRETFEGMLTRAQESNTMTPEFYLVLKNRDPDDQLADAVFEAGFDDSMLMMRSDRAAIWVAHREGELTEVVRAALEQARDGGLVVDHVEIENEAFAKAQ
jgi:hypothetical protein